MHAHMHTLDRRKGGMQAERGRARERGEREGGRQAERQGNLKDMCEEAGVPEA